MGPVVLLKAPDVLGGRAAERVNVLVVVPLGEDIELVLLPAVLPREGRNRLVLGLLDVLVFVDQHPAETAQQPVPELVALLCLTGASAGQPPGCLLQYLIEDLAGLLVGAGLVALEGAAHQPHSQRVASLHRHAAALVADQFPQPLADLHRGMAIVGQRQYGAGVLTSDPHQVCDAVHQHPGLAGARPGQQQGVAAVALLRHYLLLGAVVQ